MSAIINNREQLALYIKADMMMNRGYFKKGFIRRVYEFFFCPDVIMKYLSSMRHYAFYSYKRQCKGSFIYFIMELYYKRRFLKQGCLLGFSIGENVFGYGLTLPHYGTIVVGNDNNIGNYAIIHTSSLIVQNGSRIGDGLFLGSGAKIISKVELGDNVWIGSNSVVNSSFSSNVLVAGIPAHTIRPVQGGWYLFEYSETWAMRFLAVEKLMSENQTIMNDK